MEIWQNNCICLNFIKQKKEWKMGGSIDKKVVVN